MKPLLAIVIPYYKIDFFEETLKSVAAQTDKRFALYIGNDASPNDPVPLVEKHFPNGDYHYFNYEKNLGGKNLAMQWERILDNVKEDWFQILGDDDVISENFVEEFYNCLEVVDKHQSNVIKFSQCWIDEDGRQINGFTIYPRVSPAKQIWRSKHIHGERSSLSEHVFRRACYVKYRFKHFPLAWYSDDYAVLQYSDNSPVVFCDTGKVYVRISGINISSMKNNEVEKAAAKYQYHQQILKHYTSYLTAAELRMEIEWFVHQSWRSKQRCNINLFSLYLESRQWRKALKAPYTQYILSKNAV